MPPLVPLLALKNNQKVPAALGHRMGTGGWFETFWDFLRHNSPIRWRILIAIIFIVAPLSPAQEIRNVTIGWGSALRLGRWEPVFVTLEDQQTRAVDLQIHGSYGEKSEAMWLHQTAPASPRPTTYALLFPINAQPSRIEVIVSDLQTGKTLGYQPLQNNSSFTPAGQVPTRLLGPNDLLVGISGDIDDSLRLQSQLTRAGIPAGVLDPLKLPANFAGYDGVSVLILAAPDLQQTTGDQDQAIVDWVRQGGNLLFIPGTTPLPPKSVLVDALPCAIGINRTVDESSARLNARELSPREGATDLHVLNQVGYLGTAGFGKIAVLPIDISPMQFPEDPAANALWKSILSPMVKIPPIGAPTELPVAEEDQNLVAGPNAAESVGRGPRESRAILPLLSLLGAAGSTPRSDRGGELLLLAGIFFLLGPVDSILLMRLGQHPRNALTLTGWIGLLLSIGICIAAKAVHPSATVETFRLTDQIGDSTVAASDLLALNSDDPMRVSLSLDPNEWWEPANQAARTYRPDRFVDAQCREDRTGCRPEFADLTGSEAQAWHGEAANPGPALLKSQLHLQSEKSSAHLVGTITNLSKTVMRDFQIATSSGNVHLPQPINPGVTANFDEPLSTDPISLDGLPTNVGDISPDRAARIDALIKSGHACIYCQMPDAPAINVGPSVAAHIQVLRAVVAIAH